MKLELDPARIAELCRKNSGPSHGLTVVMGLPFPAEITNAIAGVQDQVESLLPGRFQWYDPDHVHASIYAPLRSRAHPLERNDLPPDLDDFARTLDDVVSQWQPFPLTFAGVKLSQDGALVITQDSLERRLVSRLTGYAGIAAPKHVRGVAAVIGFLTTAEPFTSEEAAAFGQLLADLQDVQIPTVIVDRVWLVNYAHRTLCSVRGRLKLRLGRGPSGLSAAKLLATLGIEA